MSVCPVTVAIVNYNGAEYLRRTLAAVAELDGTVGEVLLVDNGSTDGSVELARDCCPGLRIVELGENLGPGAARNVMRRDASCDRILMIDNDVAPARDCVKILSAALDDHPNAVIAMPAVLLERSPDFVQFVGAEAHFVGTMALLGAGRPAASLGEDVRAVSSLVSACLLIDRARYGDRLLFDESFFLYMEDHELGLRCSLMGLDLLAVEAARCLHGEGTPGISLRHTGRFTPTRVRLTIRNRWYTILKLYEARTLVRFGPTLALFEAFQLAGALRKGWLGHWLWAARWIAANLPAVLRGRRDFAPRRARADRDVLVGGPFPLNPNMPMGPLARAGRGLLDWVGHQNWRLAGNPSRWPDNAGRHG